MESTTRPLLHRLLVISVLTFTAGSFVEGIERISVTEEGNEVAGRITVSDISPDGRFVVFWSGPDDLVPGDNNGDSDVFLLDRNDNSIELISVDSDEIQHTDDKGVDAGSVSNDGRYVVFQSASADFVPDDTNGTQDIFVRDRQNGGTTIRASVSDGEMQLSGTSFGVISGNGRFVAFACDSDDAVTGDSNTVRDIFRRDLLNKETIRVSVSDGEMQATASSNWPSISDDGNRIGFTSAAENLIPNDDNGHQDMFVRDVTAGTTTRVSVTHTGAQQENGGCNESAVISANGESVAFASSATNLLPGDTNGRTDVFVREIAVNNLEVVSVATNSSSFITSGFTSFPTISPDGRYVGFWSDSTQLDPRHTNGAFHGYIRDRQTRRTKTVNISSDGRFGGNTSVFDSNSEAPYIANGGIYVFTSDSDDLVPGDSDEDNDVYQSEYAPPVAASSILKASLQRKLKKLVRKQKIAKRKKQAAKVKRFKKKIGKLKKKIRRL